MSLRRQCFRPRVTVTSDLYHTYIPMHPEPESLAAVDVTIKRADGTDIGEHDPSKCIPWLLRYPAADYVNCSVGFRWDNEIHKLPPGTYIAEIRVDCEPCARFELHVPHARFGHTHTSLTGTPAGG